MKLREAQDVLFTLHWSVIWIAWLILFVGLLLDTLLNWIVLTIVFVDVPRETLSTARVRRLKKSSGWRQRLSVWLCDNFLNPFDNNHCGD